MAGTPDQSLQEQVIARFLSLAKADPSISPVTLEGVQGLIVKNVLERNALVEIAVVAGAPSVTPPTN